MYVWYSIVTEFKCDDSITKHLQRFDNYVTMTYRLSVAVIHIEQYIEFCLCGIGIFASEKKINKNVRECDYHDIYYDILIFCQLN